MARAGCEPRRGGAWPPRVAACLVTALWGCGSPAPSPSVPEVVVSPAASPAPSVSPAPSPPSPAAHLVGRSSPDLLLDPPEGLHPRGERILESAAGWGLVAASLDGLGEVVVLDRLDDREHYVIEAVLLLPPRAPAARVAWDYCNLDGAPADRVVALVTRDDVCAVAEGTVERAWRAAPEQRRFDAVDPDRVRCPAPHCADVGTNALTAPGGTTAP